MWPDRVSNSGPLAHESDALPTALRGPAKDEGKRMKRKSDIYVTKGSNFCDFILASMADEPSS